MKLRSSLAIAATAFLALTCTADNGTETLTALRAVRLRLHTVRDRLNVVAMAIKKDAADGKPFPDREWASLAETRALLLRLQDSYLEEDEKAIRKDKTIPYERRKLFEITAGLDVADVTAAYLSEMARISREKSSGRKPQARLDPAAIEREAARNLPRVYSDYRRSEWTLYRATVEPIDLTDKLRENLEMRDMLAYDPGIALDATARDGLADVALLAIRHQRDATYLAARHAVRKATLESLQKELNLVRTEIEFGRNTPENEKKLATLRQKMVELGQEVDVADARR